MQNLARAPLLGPYHSLTLAWPGYRVTNRTGLLHVVVLDIKPKIS